jgi:hypothetical protein
MDVFNWIFTGLSLVIPIAGGACAVVLPILILGGLGIFLYRRSRQSNVARQATQSWPSTTGTVLASSIQIQRTGRSRSEIPAVVYQYQVNGQSYQSHTIRAGEQYFNVRMAGQAQATVARYLIGTTVTVYYNPENPGQAALER